MTHRLTISAIGLAMLASACASGVHSDALRGGLDRVDPRFEAAVLGEAPPSASFDGHVAGYIDYAVRQSPTLQARYAQWRAAIEKVGASDKLPEPTLTYGVFLQRVETRVGAQRQRLGLRFALPWPDKLDASADAAAREARAAGYRFEAEVIALERRVRDAYWPLWAIHERRVVLRDQHAILEQLAASIRARLEIGRATVADLSQIELSLSRLTDTLLSLDASQREAEANLLGAVGAPQGSQAPIASDAFRQAQPSETPDALLAQARTHPSGLVQAQLAEAQRAVQKRAEADRYPDLVFGIDYIETAEIEGVSIPDNGKDPIAAVIGLKLPIWGDAYGANEASARSRALAFEHQRGAIEDALQSQILRAVARIEDTLRRLALFDSTLIPQAETTFGSAIGAYEADGRTVAAILLAYRDLGALRLDKIELQTRHALAWSWLESAVGRTVDAEDIP